MADTAATLEIFLPENEGENADGSYNLHVSPFVDPNAYPLVASRGNITRSNVRIYGNGKYRTILRQITTVDEPVFMVQVDQANISAVLTNIQIDNLSMIGSLSASGGGGYNEQNNLIFVGGVNGFKVQLAEFRDFEGDGLFMGSPEPKLLIHNYNLQVIDCVFEGVSKGNRNAISILDCTNWSITGTYFLRCSNPNRPEGTPGAIDVEPELPDNKVKNGVITQCYFSDIGGNAVALLNGKGAECSGLTFSSCNISGLARSVLEVQGFDDVTATNLYADGMGFALVIRTTSGVTVKDSTFRNADSILIGNLNASPSYKVTFQNNGFYRCGKVNGAVIIQGGNVDLVKVMDNVLIECGASGVQSPLYLVQAANAQQAKVLNLTITGNTVQPANSNITNIGTIVATRLGEDPGTTYNNVVKTDNSPTFTVGENLNNYP